MILQSLKDPEKSVNSSLTDAEAANILRKLEKSRFAQGLAAQPRWSHEQRVWAHIIANTKILKKGASAPVNLNDVSGILAIFANVKGKLQNPTIRLMAGTRPITISLGRERSRYEGLIVVRNPDENMVVGTINADGVFGATPRCFPAVVYLLKEFAADAAGTAAAYGKLTGNCCFCAHRLTDHRSTEVGYGPICAGNFGLPWG